MATALFSYPSSDEGFLFFVYIVGYQSMVMTGFVRRVCVYLAGREEFEWVYELITMELFLPLFYLVFFLRLCLSFCFAW